MFEHILVPVDGSLDSWFAVRQAIQIAKEEDSTLHGLFVTDRRLIEAPHWSIMEPYVISPIGGSGLTQLALDLGRTLSIYGQHVLRQVCEQCEQAGVTYELEYVEGNVSRIILERARNANIVVMGRHGVAARWSGMLLRSTFEAVVRRVTVPVLATQTEVHTITSILVAYDGSDRARDAIKFVTHLASRQNRRVVLLTVDDGWPGRKNAFEEGKALLHTRGFKLTPIFWKGHAAELILRVARLEVCDLIVMGAHGHSRFLEVFFGSTTDEVMNRTIYPILICH